VVSICDRVKAKKQGAKDIHLSFDEWNVWYHSNDADQKMEPWQVAPPLLEDVYNFEDAVLVGCMLVTLLKHADRVKIACLAQLVNVIAPIMTQNGGPAWRQTIFYPFAQVSNYGRGEAFPLEMKSPVYEDAEIGEIPYIEGVSVWNEEEGALNIFCANLNLEDDACLNVDLRSFPCLRMVEHAVLHHDDAKAANTMDAPDTVRPVWSHGAEVKDGHLEAVLPAFSWNMIRLAVS
jgi:alpha-N-arabinofuranosidase